MSTPMIWGRLRDHIFDSGVNWWFGFGPYRLSRLGVEDWGNKQKLGFLHDSFGMIATASHYHLWYTHISIYILGAWPFSCRGTWSRATHAVPLGVGIHTHVSTQFMFLFLSVVYRLSHWHASFHTHTHIEMVRRANHAKTHCHSFNSPPKQERTERTGTLNMLYVFLCTCFWQSLCNHTNTTCMGTALFLPASALYPALPHQSNKSKMHRHKDKIHAMFCVHVLFCKAHASTDWAKRIGTVMFYCMPQRFKMQFSTKARKNRTHWHTEHVVCFFVYTCFWQSLCNHTNNTTCMGTALFLPASALYPALPHQSNKSKMHRHKDKIHAMFCVHVLFCKAHASTDWAKRIGTVMFYCMPQRYKMQFSTKARKNRTHWHTEHVVCFFVYTCFWQSLCNHTNTKCIGTPLFSTSLSFISCLASLVWSLLGCVSSGWRRALVLHD